MITIYYENTTDYNNRNRFFDEIEGDNNMLYNSFLSANSVDLYYKVNNRLEKINLGAPNFIPLSLNGNILQPNSYVIQRVDNSGTKIIYNNETNTTTKSQHNTVTSREIGPNRK